MADSAAIVRLMKHAADRLAKEDVHEILSPGASVDRRDRAVSAAVSMTYAEAILRTVAAVLDDPAEATSAADRHARLAGETEG